MPGTSVIATDKVLAAGVLETSLVDFQVPNSAVIAGLVLLILFVLLTIIMIIVRHRGGRRNSWYDSSGQSTPQDDTYAKPVMPASGGDRPRRSGEGGTLLGEGGALLGDTPFQSPAHLLPPASPRPRNPGFLLRYQSPLDDKGHGSGVTSHYAEPWGKAQAHQSFKPSSATRAALSHVIDDVKAWTKAEREGREPLKSTALAVSHVINDVKSSLAGHVSA